ncbi:TPA: hypothetical protein N0F65_001517 [Lagenidium giganteum]|uniref:Protein kinase domain-containing protein n=1 Tax=Lagenidium giganteum TaxID=4803 RepID=A0AAV2Z100_9STRA|nr:TPA: hypothetical protein N0F65_001517 [Lagenidium giganteum]
MEFTDTTVVDRIAQVDARITAQQAARMRLHGAAKRSAAKSTSNDEIAPLIGQDLRAQFRRCHSKPEQPTSNVGARAMEEQSRRRASKNGGRLIFLRNFSVSEEDVVICNRVRSGIDPTWLRHQNAHDRRFLRSRSALEPRMRATLNALETSSGTASHLAVAGLAVDEDEPFEGPVVETENVTIVPAPLCQKVASPRMQSPVSVADTPMSPTASSMTKREKAMHGRYLIRESFANGSYGRVCAGEDVPSKQEVAVKIIPKYVLITIEEKQSVMREKVIHKSLDHPHIIKLIDDFEDDTAHYFILERAANGSLSSKIGYSGLEESRCRQIFGQLLLALAYLHSHNIVHHDIKPHNILLHKNDSVKLCDFGASRALDVNQKTLPFAGVFGTPGYIAPELLLGEKAYGPEIDMFSGGVLLFEMVFGYAPFYPPSSCTYAPVEFPERCVASPEVKDLIARLLCKHPADRITAAQALDHPWLHSVVNDGWQSPRRGTTSTPTHSPRASLSPRNPASPQRVTVPTSSRKREQVRLCSPRGYKPMGPTL